MNHFLDSESARSWHGRSHARVPLLGLGGEARSGWAAFESRMGLFRVLRFEESLQTGRTHSAGTPKDRGACPHRCPITFEGRSRQSRQRRPRIASCPTRSRRRRTSRSGGRRRGPTRIHRRRRRSSTSQNAERRFATGSGSGCSTSEAASPRSGRRSSGRSSLRLLIRRQSRAMYGDRSPTLQLVSRRAPR